MTRPLPQPVKPRKLTRAKHFDGYVTSDGRYEFRPTRYGTDRRVRFWNVKDTTGALIPSGDIAPSLDAIRKTFCAPGGRVPWLVCDMDDGVLRVEPSMRTAAAWAQSYACAPVRGRQVAGRCYDYVFGHPGEDSTTCVFIMPADIAHRHIFDPVQQPLYPYPDDPFEQVDRPAPKTQGTA